MPYDVEVEDQIDPQVKSWLAFARQKLGEVVTLGRALREGREAVADELAASREAVADRANAARVHDERVQQRVRALRPEDADGAQVAVAEPVVRPDHAHPRRPQPARKSLC